MFEVHSTRHGFSVLMDTDLANVDRCVEQIALFLKTENSDQHLFPLSLLAREALNNAMVHGNKLEAGKRVCFGFQRHEDGFTLQVEDQGPGFDWTGHLNATSQSDDVSGRGHEIFRNYAHCVRYETPGNRLTLEYKG